MAKSKRVKAIKWYVGTDSYGRMVEVAQSTNGRWFSRNEIFNKWGPCEPVFVTKGINTYTGEAFEYEEPRIEWGFSTLELVSGSNNLRLPA